MNLSAIVNLIETIVGALSRRSKVKALVLPLIEKANAITGSDEAATYESRRLLVVGALMETGIGETDAYILTHAGLKLWKKIQAKAAKKAAKAAARQR